MRRQAWAGIGLLHATAAAAEYVWPSKYDWLEDVFVLQGGYVHFGFMDAVSPCYFDTGLKGRQIAAEWLRTAYHDMSTHDAASRTGGLDASIMFELDRDENKGAAFNTTFGFFSNYYSVKSSAADLPALSVVTVSDVCGGQEVPFRPGPVDATEAGPMGVPEPQQDLETHTNIFAKAGFNTSDMITMVACGHTLGGVHNEDFPEITGDTEPDVMHHFEAGDSFGSFDNAVVTEYLDGSTINPLVSGSNDTTNSDKRVFAADGNVTMKALADPATFQSKCADILERMINTVPSAVTLSDVMKPIEIKPYVEMLALNNNGTIDFQGKVRVRITERPNNEDIEIRLTYADRSGSNASTTIETTRARFQGGTSSGLGREQFAWWEFTTTLDADAGISKFNIHLMTPSTGVTEVLDNAGNGFPLDDSVLYQIPQSCIGGTPDTGMNLGLTVAAAVRKDRADEPLVLDLAHAVPRQGVELPALEVRQTAFDKTGEEKGGYVMFEAKTTTEVSNTKLTFDIVLGSGETQSKVEFQDTNTVSNTCASS